MSLVYRFPAVLLLCLLITGLRLFYLHEGTFSVFFDEAQYWFWSHYPDWGYFSKPPVVAWVIGLTTGLCGETPFCLKLGAPVLHMMTALFVYAIAVRLFDRRIGFWSALLYLTLPGVTVSSAFISADAPLMLAWAAAVYAFIRATDSIGDTPWAVLGVICGIGLLSKYTMFIFFPCIAGYLFFTAHNRHYLFSLSFWITVAVSLVVFYPNLAWNLQHGFVSFSHTGDNMFSFGVSLYPVKALEFFAAQFAVFGPITGMLLVMSIWHRPSIRQRDAVVLLQWFTYPLLLVAILLSLVSGAQAHWAAPAYITGTILVVYVLSSLKKLPVWGGVSLGLHSVALLVFLNFTLIASAISLPVDPFRRVRVWEQLAVHASLALNEHPDAVLLCDERKCVSSLTYQLRSQNGDPYPVVKWYDGTHDPKDHFDMVSPLRLYKGRDFLLVTRHSDVTPIATYFAEAKMVKQVELSGESFTFYLMHQFRGF